MRFPSQLSDTNLYSSPADRRRGRPPRQAKPFRTLVRMVVALVLVLVVMRRAGDRRIYEAFFPDTLVEADFTRPGDLPRGVRSQVSSGPGRVDAGVVDLNTEERRASPPEQVTREAESIVAALSVTDQSKWLGLMYAAPRPASQQSESDVAIRRDFLSTLADATRAFDRSNQDAWVAATGTLHSRSPRSTDFIARLRALRSALRDAAVARCVDGATWRGSDFDAYYALIREAESIPVSGAPRIGVTPLLQQPEIYRGTVVRIRGMVARCEQVHAPENRFGVGRYWRLWVVPDDGSNRLVEFITQQVDDEIASLDPSGTATNGPNVDLVGRYLKRRSYAAASGAELAPVVIGRSRLRFGRAGESPGRLAGGSPPNGFRLALSVSGAMLVGVLVATGVMWRSRAAERRLRSLRVSDRAASTEFLTQMESNETRESRDSGDSSPRPT